MSSYQYILDVNIKSKKNKWYLHMIKEVSYPSTAEESSTVLWVCERFNESKIQIQWNPNFQLFYTKDKPQIGGVINPNSSIIASLGASYTWNGEQLSFSGASYTPGAIQVWNYDSNPNPQEYFGISQTPDVISTLPIESGSIPTCVAAAKKAGSKEFFPTYYCTLWLSQENTRPRTVVAIPKENTTTVVVLPLITTTITLNPPKKILKELSEDDVNKEETKVIVKKEETKKRRSQRRKETI